jgi:hypothetical protein
MPIFWEEFGKWRCSSIHSWPRNQPETVGFAGGWVGPLTYLFEERITTCFPGRNRTPFPVAQSVAWFLFRNTGKWKEGLQIPCRYRTCECTANNVLCPVSWIEIVSLLHFSLLCFPLIHSFSLLVSNPARYSKQSLLHRHRVTFLEQAASFNTH